MGNSTRASKFLRLAFMATRQQMMEKCMEMMENMMQMMMDRLPASPAN